MKKLFSDILNIDDVEALMLFSFDGELIFENFQAIKPNDLDKKAWWSTFLSSLNGIREADMIFEKRRLYARKTEMGYLIVLTGLFAPIAMLRLNCDILLPLLKNMKEKKSLKRFFKLKK